MLEIFTLGEYRILYKGKSLKFGSRKISALLIYILLNRKTFSRESIASIFWDELNSQDALSNLSRQIYFARNTIPPQVLSFIHKKDILLLDIPGKVWIDVHELESLCSRIGHVSKKEKADTLKKIMNIYKGDFLEDFYIKGAEDFSEWLYLEQERLKNKYISTLNNYCKHYIDDGEQKMAVELAKESIRRDPHQEEVHQRLMYLYNSLGQAHLSIKQYEACITMLAKDGFKPSSETESLYKEIRSKKLPEEELRLPEPGRISISLIHEEKPIKLLGRKKEFDYLTSRIKDIKTFNKRVVFITGQSGSGKSRLVLDALRNFTNNYYVLTGSCFQFQSSVSFHPFIKALRDFFQSINYQVPVKGIWLNNLLSIFPELEEKMDFVHMPVSSHEDLRIQLFESFQKLLVNLSSAYPLVFFIDNWQWADYASAELLDYMVGNSKDKQILFLINIQEDSIKERESRYLLNFKNSNTGEVLNLKNIVQADLLPLFKENKPENKEISSYLYKNSSGNPFLLNEVLKLLEDTGRIIVHPDGKIVPLFKSIQDLPDGILTLKMKDFIEKRLSVLTSQSRNLLDTASVLEEDFDVLVLKKIHYELSDEVINLIDELLRNRILKEQVVKDQIRYSFIHSKIRDYVYSNLTNTKRVDLHKKIAELIKENFKNPEFYSKIAFHYDKAFKFKEACEYYERASFHAESIYQYKEAIQYYKILIKGTEDQDKLVKLHLNLVSPLFYSGDYRGVLDYLNKAKTLTYKVNDLLEILDWKAGVFNPTIRSELKDEILNDLKKIQKLKLTAKDKVLLNYEYVFFNQYLGLNSLKSQIKYIKNNLSRASGVKILSREARLNLKFQHYYFLSMAYLFKGSFNDAKPYINKALSFTQREEKVQKGYAMSFRALVYYHLSLYFIGIEDFKEAVLYIKKTKILFEKINSPLYNIMLDNKLLSNFYIKQGDFKQAHYYLSRVENSIREIPADNYKQELIRNKRNFAEYFLLKSDIRAAKKYFKEYIKLLEKSELPFWDKMESFTLEARLLSREKNKSKADIGRIENLFLKAVRGLRKLGYGWKLADAQYELAVFEKSINNIEKYKKYLKDGLRNYKLSGNSKKVKQINYLLDKSLLSKGG